MTITSRASLIDALQEASELEHGLMLQYLFAALSVKQSMTEGLSAAQEELVRSWKTVLLGIAREEMAHLGTVCNLLAAIGGSPRFGRPNFPQLAKDYYPFAFSLTPLSDQTLYRFVRFELPQGEPPPEPPKALAQSLASSLDATAVVPTHDPVEYEYVGQLYREIRAGFDDLHEDELFIGPQPSQEFEEFTRRMRIISVTNRKTAFAAIDFVIQQGEGAPQDRSDSHYGRFVGMRRELVEQTSIDPRFSPAREVVVNPRTRPHRDAPVGGTLLTNPVAVAAVEFFNDSYEVALLLLAQMYSYGGETLGERTAIRDAARQLMTLVIRPAAELITELPAASEPDGLRAGPSFELYSPFQLSTQLENRWTVLDERLATLTHAAAEMGAGVHPRFAFMAQNIALIANSLRAARETERSLTVSER